MSSVVQLLPIGYYTFRNNDVIGKAEYSNIKFVLGLDCALFAFMDTHNPWSLFLQSALK